MENSKTSRYFKYAIGEIILVVIGILITENLAPPEVSIAVNLSCNNL